MVRVMSETPEQKDLFMLEQEDNRDVYNRLSRLEQDVSGIDATLQAQGDMLREIRNEQLRPKPSTNWFGILSLAFTLVAGGGIYVRTQVSPLKETQDQLIILTQESIASRSGLEERGYWLEKYIDSEVAQRRNEDNRIEQRFENFKEYLSARPQR